jgi:hypothetical protein
MWRRGRSRGQGVAVKSTMLSAQTRHVIVASAPATPAAYFRPDATLNGAPALAPRKDRIEACPPIVEIARGYMAKNLFLALTMSGIAVLIGCLVVVAVFGL